MLGDFCSFENESATRPANHRFLTALRHLRQPPLKLFQSQIKVERRNDRLNRLGLTVSIFPQTPFHSSGLIFCAIGQSKAKELITDIGQYGQSWSFDLQLGISTGGQHVRPWDVDDDDMEEIIKENYFTVEGKAFESYS